MPNSGRVPVRFDRPPVVEVVCGISFALSKPIRTAHIGLYWSRVAEEFPRCEDAPPIAMVIEGQGASDSIDYKMQIEQLSLPPLRRSWLINEAGTNLVQLQDDRFLFNWKRDTTDAAYPSYEQVVAGFREQWANYKAFLTAELAEPVVTQLELTYWNFWVGGPEFLRDHARDVSKADRFLPSPEAINFRTIYGLPDGAGRLHVAASSARHSRSGEKGVRLELTARGMPRDISERGCAEWFDLAHEWITQGFADMTTEDSHTAWGRTA